VFLHFNANIGLVRKIVVSLFKKIFVIGYVISFGGLCSYIYTTFVLSTLIFFFTCMLLCGVSNFFWK
jgi:hypothetical protein